MASYNCSDSSSSAYGAGNFGTCANETQSVGAPNTGVFQQVVSSAGFTIIAPMIVAITVVVIASVVIKFRKKATTQQ